MKLSRATMKFYNLPLIKFLIFFSPFCYILYSCDHPSGFPTTAPNNDGLILPEGFGALVVADSIGKARHLAVNDNGDIYVKLRYAKETGSNVALRDTTGDGKADIITYFGDYKDEGSLANGMRIHDGYLYYSAARVVYRNKLVPGQLVPDTPMEVVLTDDHEHGIHWHITKPVAFDEEGYMYVPFGSPSNACQDMANKPGGIPGSTGLDPCPELIEHGGVWRFKMDQLNMTQKDGELYATGIRSVVAMDYNREDKNLYLVMHGRDNLHLLYPETFSQWESAVLPSEEFIRVEEGGDYGWPYCYYDQINEKKVLAPEYGGDGEIIGRCADMDKPILGFPGHWAPNDLLFYTGDQFPDRYKNGAFIAFHGSTNRSPYQQSGHFVAFVPFENGQVGGDWEVFANGFAGKELIINTNDAEFRPMGLAQGPDGSLYVSDSRVGKIWRILYKCDKATFGEAELAKMEAQKLVANIRNPHPVEDNLDKGQLPEGKKVYNTYCSPCHQRDGKGAKGRIPELSNTDWVTGDKSRLIEIVLNGLEGEIEVNEELYDNIMPAHQFLTDEQISKVLTFIRQNFDNNASAVSKEEVAKIRAKILK
ncbi:c-type cytochrome [uncultured Cyclobacterium sp.]|uniref:PQQ-dependent sugar dehydrogenase n=1 Tax=uncultured Cyclobacterium sp. TaxID=453820 RepID=UPI0030EF41E4